MRIFVDADACPVKSETIKVAVRYSIPVVQISNGGIRPSRDLLITNITVSAGADAADDRIVDECEPGDIVITADIPLAARVLDKSAFALSPTGKQFTQETIGLALATRELKQHLRETTQGQTYNASFSHKDRSRFLQALDRLVVGGQNT